VHRNSLTKAYVFQLFLTAFLRYNVICQLQSLILEINVRVLCYSHVEFGMVDCGHLVVTGSQLNISVWNLLTLSLMWTVPVNVSVLTADPHSEFMAIFTSSNDCKCGL
jgi:hypothetical protein